jgi:putative transposase
MPWLETSSVNERARFIAADRRGLYTRAELCTRYGISRKTGYKWLGRFAEDGRRGLQDRSHAPHHCPHRIGRELAELLCGARRAHPDWGPGKLLDWLGPRHPEIAHTAWPAVSTVGDLFAREGLVKKRRRRRPRQHPGVVPPVTTAPNDLWTADFKGQFPTQDGVWCYPLTIGDQHTRYFLACQGLPNIKGRGARPVFERTCREFGLPRAIRTDNGVPFASCGIHGLSQLNVWWMRLGIQHQRIHPASPQENGAHERLHRTLKAGAGRPPRATLAAQQRAFNRFRALYHDERPTDADQGVHYVRRQPSGHSQSPMNRLGRLLPFLPRPRPAHRVVPDDVKDYQERGAGADLVEEVGVGETVGVLIVAACPGRS